MSRKTQKSYCHVFKYIKENLLDMECQSFTMDFEKAVRKALKQLYPNAKQILCWFHFCQAVKKRAMQNPQFYSYIRANKEAEEIYYKLLSLPLLPANLIIEQFQRLKVIALARHRVNFAALIAYYEYQWITMEGPEKISVFKTWTRTTGALEAYNGAIGHKIIKRGNFFKFVKVTICNSTYT